LTSIDQDRQLLEDIMTKSQNYFSFATIAFAAAVIAMPLMSSGASADATSSLKNCKYNSRAKTVDCCNKVIRQYRKPLWMRTSDKGCSDVVSCYGYEGKRSYYCYINIYDRGGDGNNGGEEDNYNYNDNLR
jgi:hypothetical protein